MSIYFVSLENKPSRLAKKLTDIAKPQISTFQPYLYPLILHFYSLKSPCRLIVEMCRGKIKIYCQVTFFHGAPKNFTGKQRPLFLFLQGIINPNMYWKAMWSKNIETNWIPESSETNCDQSQYSRKEHLFWIWGAFFLILILQ